MRNTKALLVRQLDEKLSKYKSLAMIPIPEKGWINAIRTTLNMTMSQLGKKLLITRQGVKNLEESEAKGSISLKSLKDVGEALNMKLVYGFVPRDGSIDNYIQSKADELARKIVLRTNQNMVLEDQGLEDKKIEHAINDLSAEIKREMRRSMWE